MLSMSLERTDQSDAPHVGGLLADIERARADVQITVGHRGDDLRKRDVVGGQFLQVDVDVVFLGQAAPTDHVDDAGNGAEAFLEHPILERFEISEAEIFRRDELVAINFADGTLRRDLRLRAVGKRRQRADAVEHLLERVIVIGLVGELEFDVRKPVERTRTDMLQTRQPGHGNFNWNGDVALNLFGGLPRALRDDFHHRRRRIGIGFDVQPAESIAARAEEQDQHGQHHRAARQGEFDELIEHGSNRVAIRVCRSGRVAQSVLALLLRKRLPSAAIVSPALTVRK